MRALTADLALLLTAIAAGAVVQAGVGIGFSIVVAPVMMVMLGTAVAVPVLLLLNAIVSATAVDPRLWWQSDVAGMIGGATLSCTIGMLAGIVIYPSLPEQTVLLLTAGFLAIGLASSAVAIRPGVGAIATPAAGVGSGLATVWAATPGPLMILGFLIAGRTGQEARVMVQNVALMAYSGAFGLHLLSGPSGFWATPGLTSYGLAAVAGALLGRSTGSMLPQRVLETTIRLLSIVACAILVHRALTLD